MGAYQQGTLLSCVVRSCAWKTHTTAGATPFLACYSGRGSVRRDCVSGLNVNTAKNFGMIRERHARDTRVRIPYPA